ncbi:methyl farnesoate epoxidase-like [Ischnura elegans]|uniref:methyl farnesoate epoxidase-like n=1 Tax=Ischnura elegans TaxID=197161 RepID=UPI001ED8A6E3|nr:methyl farnesoate epoxidase-like [Ischnura elegans]
MIVDLILAGIALYFLWLLLLAKPKSFPPGPVRFPVIGNIYHLRKWGPYLYQSMAEMKRRYGEVAGFFVGPNPIILVSGLEAIKELSFREDLSGRPSFFHHKLEKVKNGLLFTMGERWKEQRRFTLRHLRDFGFGKSSMESITIEEIEAVFSGIDKSLEGENSWSKPIVVHDILGTANINVIWHILAGKRYSLTDPLLNQLLNYVKDVIAQVEIGGKLEMAFPKLVELLPFLSNAWDSIEKREKVRNFIKKAIDEHKISIDYNSPRDFIDIYLAEMARRKEDPDSTFTDPQLTGIGFDLFGAGYDTTFNTIVFSLLYMILNPEVQKKVQEELDSVVGRDRLPSFQDRDSHRIPYTEATVMEILRCSTVVPMSVPHAPLYCSKDIEFRGHIIPKNSQIFLNLYDLHHDPAVWGDPENFRPERFLNQDGKVIRNEAFIPFGIGKRSCLGESLARNNVFLFFACLMQRYSMQKPDGEAPPSDEPVGNITIMPKPFKVQVMKRH